MSTMRHLASPIAKSFSEALRIDTEAGNWIFVSGQVGVAIPPNNEPVSFEQEVRVTFHRIGESLRKLGADMENVVSIKVYLTDLGPYAEFSKVRGEVFPRNPAHIDRSAGRRPSPWGTHRDRRSRLNHPG